MWAVVILLLVYLPIARNEGCFTTPQAAEFYNIILADPGQLRADMRCNHRLTLAAERHAMEMATQAELSHCDAMGQCSNDYAYAAGCALPYEPGRNDIESIVAGVGEAAEAAAALLRSDRHREHLLGLAPLFAAQGEIGIAFVEAPGSTYTHYYVFVSAATC